MPIDEGPPTEIESEDQDGNLLASLAILSVNASQEKRSYLDHFIPFAVETLTKVCHGSGTHTQISVALKKEFGLSIPASVVHDILKRAEKMSLVKQDGRLFRSLPQPDSDHASFEHQRNGAMRDQGALAERLMRFADSEFGVTWNMEEAHAALQNLVGKMGVPLMRSVLSGATHVLVAPLRQSDVSTTFITSEFVTAILREDPVMFSCLESMVKGAMLASALYFPGAGETTRRFRNTTIWIDTPLALQWLGLEGEDSQHYVSSVLELALKQGARLGVFTHSLIEMRGIVYAASGSTRSANNHRPGKVALYFKSKGITFAEARTIGMSLEEKLNSKGAIIEEVPPYLPHLDVEEDVLERTLQEIVHYQSPATLLCDLDSLTAIHRLRKGATSDRIEDCKAIFLTDNTELVVASNTFFGNQKATMPIATIDHEVASLLWSKFPMSAPDLPKNQMIADALAALQPSPALWHAYSNELGRLVTRKPEAAEAVMLLRHSTEAQRFLMKETLADPSRVTPEVVNSIYERLIETGVAPVREQLTEMTRQTAQMNADNQALQSRLLALEAREIKTTNLVIQNAKRKATYVRNAVRWISIGSFICTAWWFVHLGYHSFYFPRTIMGTILGYLSTAFSIVNLWSGVAGHTLFKIADGMYRRVQKRLQDKNFAKLALERTLPDSE